MLAMTGLFSFSRSLIQPLLHTEHTVLVCCSGSPTIFSGRLPILASDRSEFLSFVNPLRPQMFPVSGPVVAEQVGVGMGRRSHDS